MAFCSQASSFACTEADVCALMNASVQHVADVFGMHPAIARIILQHFDWDENRALT